MRIFVYRNLHKQCYSVKALEGPNKGRVIAHVDNITLADVTFKVSEAGRQRVLRERRKNVHAGVVGRLFSAAVTVGDGQPVRYNPYKLDGFALNGEPGKEVKSADWATLNHKGIMAEGLVFRAEPV